MTINRLISFLVVFASSATAEVVPLDFAPMDGGLWNEPPESSAFDMPTTRYADIITMADLDGDPNVISDQEREMIALLAQVLGISPVTN